MPKKQQGAVKRNRGKKQPAGGKSVRIEEGGFARTPPQEGERPLAQAVWQEEIPEGYGETRLVLLVRDPCWVHAYWEISEHDYRNALAEADHPPEESVQRVLRLHEIGEGTSSSFDIRLDDAARNWYVKVNPDRSYEGELGLAVPPDRFITLARSNRVRTPPAGMSDVIDDRWRSLSEEYYEKMYALSGGLEVGKSSLELRRMLEERLRSEIASGAVSSFGGSPVRAEGGEKERSFWFVLDAELIIYGATVPNARVTVQGHPVALRPDGSFTLRFALPDGTQRIEARAVSPDGLEERRIIPTVTRTTEVPDNVLLDQ